MSRKSNSNAFILIAVIALLAGAVYFNVFNFSNLSFVSLSQPQLTNGKLYWVATATVDNPSESFQFNIKPDATTLTNGTTVTPKNAITVKYSPTDAQCVYTLTHQQAYGYFDYYLMSFGEKHLYYSLTAYKYGLQFGTTNVVDGGTGSPITIQDPSSNGQIVVSNIGYTSGVIECPTPQSYYVYQLADGTARVTTKSPNDILACNAQAAVECSVFPPSWLLGWCQSAMTTCATKYPDDYSWAKNFNNYAADWSKAKLTAHGLTNAKFGSVILTMTADASVFDSVYFTPNPVVTPKIIDMTVADVSSGQQGTVKVIVQNTGDTAGMFSLTLSSDHMSFIPSTQTATVNAGSNYIFYATTVAGSVTSDTTQTTTANVCTSNQFEGSKCDIRTATSKIIAPSTNPIIPNPKPTSYCGDGICDPTIGESAQTCSQDCGTTPDCQTLVGQGYYWNSTTQTCMKAIANNGNGMPDLFYVLIIVGGLAIGYGLYKKVRK